MSLLSSRPDAPEKDLRAAIVETGRITYASGLLASNDGNISARLADDSILITPSGLCKGRLQPDDLLIIDMEGHILRPAADASLRPTSEQAMHLEVYRLRRDVRAVLHAHPPYATALTISRSEMRMDILPEMALALGKVPFTRLAMPSSPQDAEVIRELIPHHNALMLRQHGSLTVGANLDQALIHLERLEHVAKTIFIAELLGNVSPLPAEMLDALNRQRLEAMVNEALLQALQGE